ncbi:MAG: 23S rRNA (guanosine(2251)-2'-O)-methyltransferase RlmB [Polyangiaceae bacterium]|nr:23S rRNA (guanosine(2251)-2'-O)-methyltransferase RlmB [Polyangiaceae bacterium]
MTRQIFGMQPVREAIRAHGNELRCVFVQNDGGPKLDAVARFAADHGIAVERVPRGELDRRTKNGFHQGVLAIAPEVALVALDDLKVDPNTLILALDGVMDPHNFGAAIRSAVALGATGIVWPEHASAPLSPATFRASAGAVEHATLCRVPALPQALHELKDRGVTPIALDVRGTSELSDLSLTGPLAIVIGAEDRGPRKPVLAACTHVARLPLKGPVTALNASVAAAIALYEVGQQRRAARPSEATATMENARSAVSETASDPILDDE